MFYSFQRILEWRLSASLHTHLWKLLRCLSLLSPQMGQFDLPVVSTGCPALAFMLIIILVGVCGHEGGVWRGEELVVVWELHAISPSRLCTSACSFLHSCRMLHVEVWSPQLSYSPCNIPAYQAERAPFLPCAASCKNVGSCT